MEHQVLVLLVPYAGDDSGAVSRMIGEKGMSTENN